MVNKMTLLHFVVKLIDTCHFWSSLCQSCFYEFVMIRASNYDPASSLASNTLLIRASIIHPFRINQLGRLKPRLPLQFNKVY